ncbi:interleukin-22 receptor subunit alpha-2 [Trichomycterus rosablanca]|uniref:interleukin-22 receptor subunit alpha-2 n=1 Tax=Trichomycterus rosablanca TaxID=2290929 RepID=UPI002F35F6EA
MLVLNAVLLAPLLLLDALPLASSSHSSPRPPLPPEGLAPVQVEFHSLNFRNVLHWKARPSGPDHLRYSVQYKVYGEAQWSTCKHCQDIQKLECDLSQETSDPRQWYYARVHAQSTTGPSAWAVSSRFYPQWDTVFSPPQIRLNVTERGIVVQIRPPRTPLQGKRSGRVSVTKLQRLKFRIYLTTGEEETIHEAAGCSKKLVIEPLESGTTYCAQAATVVPLSGVASSRSPRSCISTS